MAEARLLLAAALLAGFSYPLSFGLDLPLAAAIPWKGAGVGLLAAWASRQGRTRDHRLLLAVLLLGALADMVLELAFVGGAFLFALGHGVAIALYLRHREGRLSPGRAALWLALLLLVAAVLVGAVPPAWFWPVLAYALFLLAMAAAAGLSRLPLAFAGAGLFVVSDALIFWRLGFDAPVPLVGLLIWLLYFSGQALIALGVVRGLGSLDASGAKG
ncbi:lysoplasmalogenase family protein [Thermaurantiacus sp.]